MIKNTPTSFLFTSESVSEGHPDKICDQISDAIVDAFLAKDPNSRLGCEVMVTPDNVIIGGEIRSEAEIGKEEISSIARSVIKDIGYEQERFNWRYVNIHNYLITQSPDIAMGVDSSGEKDEGAGDQGIMFGYACDETPDLMPAPIYYAHNILRAISEARHTGELKGLGPDAKSQVTLQYENDAEGNGVAARATSVVVSHQHRAGLKQAEVKEIIRPYVQKVLPNGWMPEEAEFYVNPTGNFVIGGPEGDSGLTGRKIIVDTYGGSAPHGGGAFSGKDPSKVDRSAAYAARYLAKNIVASGVANRCTIQLAYAIGVSKPLSVYVNTHGTGKVDEQKISKAVSEIMDLSPRGIRTKLQLNKPIYRRTAAYGHFGRKPEADGGFSWEKTDLADAIKKACA
jgi:S-adenosylmethionine synthetase